MAHIPCGVTTDLEVLTFRQALEAANTPSAEYDIKKWLYAPNFYCDYRYILGTRGKKPLICIGINILECCCMDCNLRTCTSNIDYR